MLYDWTWAIARKFYQAIPRHFKKIEMYHQDFFLSKWEVIPELDSGCQNSQPDELNDLLTPFICFIFISDSARIDSGNTDYLSPLNQLPFSLWSKLPNNIGKIHSTPPFKIQIDPSKTSSKN